MGKGKAIKKMNHSRSTHYLPSYQKKRGNQESGGIKEREEEFLGKQKRNQKYTRLRSRSSQVHLCKVSVFEFLYAIWLGYDFGMLDS